MRPCGQCCDRTFFTSICPEDRLLAWTPAAVSLRPSSNRRGPLTAVCDLQHKSCVSTKEDKSKLLSRREALHAATFLTGVGFWTPIVCDSPFANAADLTQRIQRGKLLGSIQEKLRVLVKDNQSLVPSLLRLALNDAATFDKASKSGGPNGSIYLSAELNRPENKGLAEAIQKLEVLKKSIDADSPGGPIEWADLIQIAGQSAVKRTFLNAAIEKCGGDVEKGGKLYSAYGSGGQWRQFDKEFGRSNATEPDPDGRVLVWDQVPVADVKAKFDQLGFKPRQVAVLAIFLGPDLLTTEAKLASDPEVAPWVDKYQRSRETVSRTEYEVDLITAFSKLSTLGQTINYEAYTYAPPPIKFKL